jgi:hypothetical protein
VASGAERALDYAEWVGAGDPSDRLRLTSFEAHAGLLDDPSEVDALWRVGELSGSRMVAGAARALRAMLGSESTATCNAGDDCRNRRY